MCRVIYGSEPGRRELVFDDPIAWFLPEDAKGVIFYRPDGDSLLAPVRALRIGFREDVGDVLVRRGRG